MGSQNTKPKQTDFWEHKKKRARREFEETFVNGEVVYFHKKTNGASQLFHICLFVCDNDQRTGICDNVFSFGKFCSQPQTYNIMKLSTTCSKIVPPLQLLWVILWFPCGYSSIPRVGQAALAPNVSLVKAHVWNLMVLTGPHVFCGVGSKD